MNEATTDTSKYPLFSLPSCMNIAEAVRDAGGAKSDVSKASIAAHLQVDENATTLSQRISAARSYGLVEGRGSYKLTDTARSYFFPLGDQDQKRALLVFLSSPQVFNAVVKRFDGSKIPAQSMLANLLHTNFGVPESWKDRIAGFFLKSAAFAGAVDTQGFLRYDAGHHAMNSTQPHAPANVQQTEPTPRIQTTVAQGAFQNISQGEVTAWSSTHRGVSVRVEASGELPLALWEKLNAYVQVLKPLPSVSDDE